MKCYISPNELRLTGKAWEVRHYMKKLMKEHGARQQTISLKDALSSRHAAPRRK